MEYNGAKRGDELTNYMENTAMVIQNLKDAGCDTDTVKTFMELADSGEQKKQIQLLEKHRRVLLYEIHKNEKQIDCLDYLLYQMRKTNAQLNEKV